MIVLDAMITYYDKIRSEYRHERMDMREALVQESANFVSFSDPRVRPAGWRHDKEDRGPPAASCDKKRRIRKPDPRV